MLISKVFLAPQCTEIWVNKFLKQAGGFFFLFPWIISAFAYFSRPVARLVWRLVLVSWSLIISSRMKVSHHQIELPLFCMLKMVKYRHFITKLASSSTQMNVFLGVYDPSKDIRRHLMSVDRLDFPLAQPEKPSATSGRILQWFHTASEVGKKKRSKMNWFMEFLFWLDAERGIGKTQLQTKMSKTRSFFQTF